MRRHQRYDLPPTSPSVIHIAMQSYFSRLASSDRMECRNHGRGCQVLQRCWRAPCCGGHVVHDTPHARNKHSAVSKGNGCVHHYRYKSHVFLGVLFCCFALQMAFLMAASASLEHANEARGSEKVAVDSVDMAIRMLKSYKQAAQALSDRHQTLGSAPSKTEDKSHHYMLIMVLAPSVQQSLSVCSEQTTVLQFGRCQRTPSVHLHRH